MYSSPVPPSMNNTTKRSKTRWPFLLFLSSLRVRLILLVLLALVPALGIILYTAVETRQWEATRVKEEALTRVQLLAADQERVIEGARHLLIALSQLRDVRSGDPDACTARLVELLKLYPDYSGFGIARPDGQIFCSTVSPTPPINAANRPWFQRAIQSRNFAVGDYQIGQISGRAILVFSYPILGPGDQLQSVAFVALELGKLNQLAATIKLPEEGAMIQIDRNGTILDRSPGSEQWVGQTQPETPLIQTMLSQREGVAEVADVDGVTRLYAFTPLYSRVETGLYLATGLPLDIAFAEADHSLARNLAWLGAVGLLALLAAWFGGNAFVLDRVKALVHATERLRTGNLSSRTELPHDKGEFGQLARAFDEMAAALEQREAERRQAEEVIRSLVVELEQRVKERTAELEATNVNLENQIAERQRAEQRLAEERNLLRTLIDHLPDYVYIKDTQSRFIMANRAVVRDTGLLSPEELVGKTDFDIFPPELAAQYYADEQSVIQSGQPLINREEMTVYLGEKGWAATTTVPLYDQQGQIIGLVGVSRNITQRKRLEAELAEIQHRLIESREAERLHLAQELHDGPVQDLHALTYSLSGLKVTMTDPNDVAQLEAMQAVLRQVIRTLRNAAAELRPPALASFGLEKAIRSHIEQFQAIYPELKLELELMADGQILPERVRLALFRICQETLNNIVRHAKAQRVWIQLRLDAEQVMLEVQDDGQGFEVPQRWLELARQGHLGLVGISERAEAIGGQLQIISAPGAGARIRVVVPHANSPEPVGPLDDQTDRYHRDQPEVL